MNNASHRHFVTLLKPVDPSIVRVLRLLDPTARAAGCEYFVAGATARDLVLVNVHGLLPGRATRDLDFGVAVGSWAQFELLKASLTAVPQFEALQKIQQRLIYTDPTAGFSIPIDLVPFRGIESADGTFAWPPGRDIVMNVAGFEEAWASSLSIELEKDLTIRVASVPGLTLLKLSAWADRGVETNKDSADLHRLLTTYASAGNTDRIFDYELDLLESTDFDMELAGAELLGRDVAAICEPGFLNRIRSLLASERSRERLATHMLPYDWRGLEDDVPSSTEGVVNGFRRGLMYDRATSDT